MSSGFPPSQPNQFGDMSNPYQSPMGGAGHGGLPGHGREAALERVKWPAMILMGLAPLGILFALVDGVFRIFNAQNFEMLGPNPGPGVKEGFLVGQYGGMAVDLLALGLQAFVIYGAYNMLTLKSRSLAYTANIISLIPCLSACCVLGIPFGIWGLVVMNDSAVKQHFES